MANYVLVRHSVKSYPEWKREYDAHQPMRIEAGLTDRFVLQGVQDANDVTVIFEAKDLDRAKAFTESANLKEAMMKAGVQGKPDIRFLKG